ncbi:ras-related and estrogen-regulated growth inhibitor-like protein [Oppia nitens]|uniref:ras-related and estrogen-regulated growth inhibitor-like protein n=1 Tax=Oppia nitens TaxID=1686743 RepID=UPI0023D9C5C1|nr:ras-related and estrogen-regulated growth inhibitor-like protein [Oppia nitens]
MTQMSCIKILVLGAKCVGKSAITVRFLTKRYIGEYKSNTDWFYQQKVKTDNGMTNVEILDISRDWTDNENMVNKDQIEWAEAYVIIYSICDRNSFQLAQHYLQYITAIRGPVYVPIILLANKRDLEVGRQITKEEGTSLAHKFGSQFFEISAADSNLGVSQAFEWLLHQSNKISHRSDTNHSNRSHNNNHRKLSIVTVSRVFSAFGHVFGKSHHNNHNNNTNNITNDVNNNINQNNNHYNQNNGHLIRYKNQTNYALNAKRKLVGVMIPTVRRSPKAVISL